MPVQPPALPNYNFIVADSSTIESFRPQVMELRKANDIDGELSRGVLSMAVHRRNVLGYISTWDIHHAKPPTVFVNEFCVDENYRGQGLAQRLLGFALDQHPRAELLKLRSTPLAISFYERLAMDEVRPGVMVGLIEQIRTRLPSR